MDTINPILEKIRPLITTLNAQERLALIHAIAEIDDTDTVSDKLAASERHRQIASEQTAWFAQSLQQRRQYRGKFVAIKGGQVIDSDNNQRTLYLRVRDKFGRKPVAILNADWEAPPEYTIHTPSLASNDSDQPVSTGR